MLVLTRKLQEQILIGNDVVITILQVRGQAVRVGIQAPRSLRVLRAELELQPGQMSKFAGDTYEANQVDAGGTINVELTPQQPGASVKIKGATPIRQPLANRLQARRNPNSNSSTMNRQPERSASAMLVVVGAGQ